MYLNILKTHGAEFLRRGLLADHKPHKGKVRLITAAAAGDKRYRIGILDVASDDPLPDDADIVKPAIKAAETADKNGWDKYGAVYEVTYNEAANILHHIDTLAAGMALGEAYTIEEIEQRKASPYQPRRNYSQTEIKAMMYIDSLD